VQADIDIMRANQAVERLVAEVGDNDIDAFALAEKAEKIQIAGGMRTEPAELDGHRRLAEAGLSNAIEQVQRRARVLPRQCAAEVEYRQQLDAVSHSKGRGFGLPVAEVERHVAHRLVEHAPPRVEQKARRDPDFVERVEMRSPGFRES